MAGTVAWKAPETFCGKYSPASDVFSLAVLDFEILTRQLPWAGIALTEVIDKARERFDEIDRRVLRRLERGESIEQQRAEWLEDFPLEERRPAIHSAAEEGCPAGLIELAQRCWADAPEERPNMTQ
eukprot:COSAG05_NODE_12382_length_470_cov_0.822102_1_plen_125_part_10